jgi:hypothetical protein
MGSAEPADVPRVLVTPTDERTSTAVDTISQAGSRPTRPIANEDTKTSGQSGVQADALAEALRVSRSALEGLLAQTHDIHEASWRAVQSLFEDLHLRLCQECEARVAGFEKEIHDRGRYQTSALLEMFDVEAESRLAARIDQALDRAQEAERQSAKSLDDKVEATRTNLTEITSKATQELQQQKAACLEGFHAEALQRLSVSKTEHLTDFENIALKKADLLSEDLTKRTTASLDAFQGSLQRIADEFTGQLEKRLMTLTEDAVVRVSNEAQAVVTRETSSYLIQALRKRLDQLTNSLKD